MGRGIYGILSTLCLALIFASFFVVGFIIRDLPFWAFYLLMIIFLLSDLTDLFLNESYKEHQELLKKRQKYKNK